MHRTMLLGGGSHVARRLAAIMPGARVVTRRGTSAADEVVVADYAAIPAAAFDGVDTVINCVGTAAGSAALLDRVNVVVPILAARQAQRAGCRQFVQISSLSVHGRTVAIDRTTPIRPLSPYGRSKAAAEAAILALAEPGFAVRIVRAPAIYGPGTAGKFGALADVMRRTGRFPVPTVLGRRSVLNLDNAAAALLVVAAGEAVTGIDFAADHGWFDLAQLAAAVTAVTARKVRLVAMPTTFFTMLRAAMPQLHASLYADSQIDETATITANAALPVDTHTGLVATLAARWKLP